MDKKLMMIIAIVAAVAVVAVAAAVVLMNGGSAEQQYTVTYNTNGGEEISATTFTENTETFTLQTPTKENCTFIGWFTNADLTGDPVTQIAKGTKENVTVYASWSMELTNSIPAADDFQGNAKVVSTITKGAEAPSIPKDVFQGVSEGKSLTINNVDESGKTTLAWTFNGASSTQEGYNNVEVPTKVTPTEDSAAKTVTLDFEYDGTLPYSSVIKYYIGTGHAGEQYTVKNSGDTEDIGQYTVDSEGYIEFEIDHCSDWVLTYYVEFTFNAGDGVFSDGNTTATLGGDYKSAVDSSEIPVPTRTGYTFASWSPSVPEFFTEDGETSFAATYTANQYTVTFYNYDQSKLGTATVTYDQNYEGFVTAPERTGYSFVNWLDDSGAAVTSSTVYKTAGDSALYASFNVITYTATFNSNGGSSVDDVTYTVESDAITLSESTKTGYAFKGWYDNSSLTGDVYTTIAKGTASDYTFYAKWAAIEYTITYDADGGNSVADGKYTIETDTFDLPTTTKEGAAFGGWYTVNTPAETKVTQVAKGSTGDMSVKAKWVNNYATFTIKQDGEVQESNDTFTLHYNGNSVPLVKQADGTYYYETSESLPIVNGREYSVFRNGGPYDCSATAVNGIVALEVNYYIIRSYVTEGGTQWGIANIREGNTMSAPGTPGYTGYDFVNWTRDGAAYDFSTPVTAKFDLVAQWTPKIYSITYNLDDGTNGNNPATYTIETDTITLAGATKAHYDFGGWYENGQFTGDAVTQIAKGTTGDKTLYAKFTPTEYTITYDARGGNAVASETYTYFAEKAITATSTRTGYDFAGWYAEQGLQTPVTSIAVNSEGAKTLYAKWTPHQYNITYVTSQTNAAVLGSGTYTIEDTVAYRTDFAISGSAFNHWVDANGATVTGLQPGNIGDKTVYGVWTANYIQFDIVVNAAAINADGTFTIKTENGQASAVVQPTGQNGVYRIESSANFPITEGSTYDLFFDDEDFDEREVGYGFTISSGSASDSLKFWTVTYRSNVDAQFFKSATVFDGADAPSLVAPTVTGYTFSSWQSQGQDYDFQTDVKGPVDLLADYTAKQYTIVYNKNTATSDQTINNGTATFATQFTPAANVWTKVVNEVEWRFTGWNIAADGSGFSVSTGGCNVTADFIAAADNEGNITLYAQWTDVTYVPHVGDTITGLASYSCPTQSECFTDVPIEIIVTSVDDQEKKYWIDQVVTIDGVRKLGHRESLDYGEWFAWDDPQQSPTDGTVTFNNAEESVLIYTWEDEGATITVKVLDESLTCMGLQAYYRSSVTYTAENVAQMVEYYQQQGIDADPPVAGDYTVTITENTFESAKAASAYTVTYLFEEGSQNSVVRQSETAYADVQTVGFSRNDGKVFAGWCAMTEVLVSMQGDAREVTWTAGERVTGNYTVYAKWEYPVTNVYWSLGGGESFDIVMNDANAVFQNGTEGSYFTFTDTSGWVLADEDEYSWSFDLTFDERDTHLELFKTYTTFDQQLNPTVHSAGITPAIVNGELRVTYGALALNETKYYVYGIFWQSDDLARKGYVPEVGDSFVYVSSANLTYTVTKVPGSNGWASTSQYQYTLGNGTSEENMYLFPVHDSPNAYSMISSATYYGYDCWKYSYTGMWFNDGSYTNSVIAVIYVEKSTTMVVGVESAESSMHLQEGTDLSGYQTVSGVTATFNQNYGNNPVIGQGTYFGTHTVVPERDGYAFTGWNTASDGTGTSYSKSQVFTANDNNVVLYAQWTFDGAHIAIDLNNGTISQNDVPQDAEYSNGVLTVKTYAHDGDGNMFLPSDYAMTDGSGHRPLYFTVDLLGNSSPQYKVIYVQYITEDELDDTDLDRYNGYESCAKYQRIGGSNVYVSYVEYHHYGSVTSDISLFYVLKGQTIDLTVGYAATNQTITITGGTGQVQSYEMTVGTGAHYRLPDIEDTGLTHGAWTFDGYYAGPLPAYQDFETANENMTWTTSWAPYMTLAYDLKGGVLNQYSTLDPRVVKCDGSTNVTIDGGNSFTKSGYTLLGWSTNSDASTLDYLPYQGTTFPDSNAGQTVTLYAVWVADNLVYDIYFVDAADHKSNGWNYPTEQNPQRGAVGWNIVLQSGVTAGNSYRLTGWNSQADGQGTPYALGATVNLNEAPANGTLVLYAMWSNSFNVVFDSAGGSTSVANKPGTYGTDMSFTETAGTKSGYRFAGWTVSMVGMPVDLQYLTAEQAQVLGLAVGYYLPAGCHNLSSDTLTVTAKWAQLYDLTFNANEGSVNGQESVVAQFAAGEYVNASIVQTTARDGYAFGGWYTAPDGGETFNFNYRTISENITVYAHWIQVFTVTFKANGGEFRDGEEWSTSDVAVNVQSGGSVDSEPEARFLNDENGYVTVDSGWYTQAIGGSLVNLNNVTQSMNVYKHYSVRVQYNLGEGGYYVNDVEPDEQYVQIGATLTALGASGTNSEDQDWNIARNGCSSLLNWNTAYDYGGTDVALGGTITVTAGMTGYGVFELFAEWQYRTYTISFEANGGTGEMESFEYTYNSNATLPEYGFTAPAGKVFICWYCALVDAEYSNGAEIGNTWFSSDTVTFTAQWEDE